MSYPACPEKKMNCTVVGAVEAGYWDRILFGTVQSGAVVNMVDGYFEVFCPTHPMLSTDSGVVVQVPKHWYV